MAVAYTLANSAENHKKEQQIFVVATGVPENVGGAPIRNFHLIKGLSEAPHTKVELFCLCSPSRITEVEKQLTDEMPIKAHVIPYITQTTVTKLYAIAIERMQPYMTAYRLAGLGKAVFKRCQINRPDVVHIEQIDAYYCMEPYLKRLQHMGIKIVLDQHNIEAEAFKGALRTFSPGKRFLGLMIMGTLRRLENCALLNSDIVFGCSESDVAFFKELRGDKPTYLIPNGVDCGYFKPSSTSDPATLLFIGKTNYPPNVDALAYYIDQIHPKVKKLIPAIRLLAIGADKQWLDSYRPGTDSSIVPLGFVPDILPYLNTATIGICPVREGSGTRIKVLTYMSAALPVVATTKGAEGIAYTSGHEICIADTADRFADTLITLLQDMHTREQMGSAGRQLVLREYDWQNIGKKLATYYADVANLIDAS